MSRKKFYGIAILLLCFIGAWKIGHKKQLTKAINFPSIDGDIVKESKPTIKSSCHRTKVFQLVSFIEVLANLVTILGIVSLFNLPTIRKAQPIPFIAANEWEDELECLRIKASSFFIEEKIGSPISTYDSIFNGVNITTSLYLNQYFTLLCYYADNSLFGYLIISNNKNFNFRNYRCGFRLINYTMSETLDYCDAIGVSPCTFCSCSINPRLDGNRYFLQVGFQHAWGATENVYIGYGFTDIGMSNSYDIYNQVFNDSPTIQALIEMQSNDRPQLDWKSDPNIASFPINMFLIFDDNNTAEIDVEKFIGERVALNRLQAGISKDEFANYQPDFIKAIVHMGYNYS